MRIAAVVLLLVCHAAVAQEAVPENLDSLIDRLGDPSYAVREHADAQLRALGAGAAPRIRERLAQEVLDPEIRARLTRFLERYDWPDPVRNDNGIECALRAGAPRAKADEEFAITVRIRNVGPGEPMLGNICEHAHVAFTPGAILTSPSGETIGLRMDLDCIRLVRNAGPSCTHCNVTIPPDAMVELSGRVTVGGNHSGKVPPGRYRLHLELDMSTQTNSIDLEIVE